MNGADPIGLGVIGVGDIARDCLRAVQQPETGFRLAGLCALEEPALNRSAAEFGAEYVTTDYASLIAHPDVEAVAI